MSVPDGAASFCEASRWIDSSYGPLCIRIHAPSSGLARGVVVLCPSVGREHIVTHPTFRQLAEELCGAGLIAVRLDYHGTGDSDGNYSDPGRVNAWTESVRAAVRASREIIDAPVIVVGMRMGALIAATALAGSSDAPDCLLLWDPCANGRGWLREQRALLHIGVGSSGYGAVPTEGDEEELALASQGREQLLDIPSFTFSAEVGNGISQLDLATLDGALARRVVAVMSPERQRPPGLTARLDAESATWLSAPGQQELLVMASDFAVVPVQGIRVVVEALAPVGSEHAQRFVLPPQTSVNMVVPTANGESVTVREHHINLGAVSLVGVRTDPVHRLNGSPLMVLIGNSNEPHFGPSRAWVELSRTWAAIGLASIRFCVSGLGDSPTRPGQSPQVIYAAEAITDVVEAVNAAQPDSPDNVVTVGLCSGAYGAIGGALSLRARGVCALGLIPGSGAVHGGVEARQQATAPVKGWMRRSAQSPRAWALARRLPKWTWVLADWLGVAPSPARPIKSLSAAGVETLFVVGTRDARAYRMMAEPALRRLERRGSLRFVRVPALDHGMLRGGPRQRTVELLDAYVKERFIQPFGWVNPS